MWRLLLADWDGNSIIGGGGGRGSIISNVIFNSLTLEDMQEIDRKVICQREKVKLAKSLLSLFSSEGGNFLLCAGNNFSVFCNGK